MSRPAARTKAERPRPATRADLAPLARLWHAGWHEVHDAHVAPEIRAERTPRQFETRVRALLPGIRLVGPADAPAGFCAVEPGLLAQLFVAPGARRAGLGARLLADGEARLRAAGWAEAELHCHPANRAALDFYARAGWRPAARVETRVETRAGPVAMPQLVLRKAL